MRHRSPSEVDPRRTKKGSTVASDPLDEAADALADDASIDWASIDRDSAPPEVREEAKWLRIIAEIADHHRAARRESADAETVAINPLLSVPRAAAATTAWGRFELLEKIGEGAYGRVYRAWNPDLQMEIAIKLLHRQVADRTLREQLLEEGRALARIQHEHVVRVLGVESHGDQVGLCMEFVPGQTLDAYLGSRGVLNDREAAQIGEQLSRALAAVHDAGFVHRDVKARNVMRRPDGRIVLMDFGTGYKLRRAGAGPFDVIGTPRYMAPEVLNSEPPSPCSDVYSAGVLIYHLVTGGYPVEGATFEELQRAHAAQARHSLNERRPDLPRAFKHVVAKSLSPAPSQRYPTAAAMLEAYERLGRKRSVFRVLAESAVFALGIAVAWLVLGAMNSLVFNRLLGRPDFANEGWIDSLRWGARSTLAPGVLLLMGVIGLSVLMAVRRLVLRLSARARRWEEAIVAAWRRRGLDDPVVGASVALMASLSGLCAAVWAFSPLLVSLVQIVPSVSTAPLESMQYLSPHFFSYHEDYRITFTWLTIACVALWYPALSAARRRGERLHRGLVAGGVAVTALSVLFLNFPYRLLTQSQFEAATWRGNACYILGTRGEDWLLFCPELDPPRNKIVSRLSSEVQHAGAIEKIFERIPVSQRNRP
jgi:tRNA A-37 threonylcarbamoyl transferase component Bud32